MTALVRCAEWKPPGEAAPVRNLAELQLELQALLGSVSHARPLLAYGPISFAAPTTPLSPQRARASRHMRPRFLYNWMVLCVALLCRTLRECEEGVSDAVLAARSSEWASFHDAMSFCASKWSDVLEWVSDLRHDLLDDDGDDRDAAAAGARQRVPHVL